MNEVLFRLLALLLVGAAAVLVLRPERPEIGFLLSLSVGATALLLCLAAVFPTVRQVRELFADGGVSPAPFRLALQAFGISYVSGLAADTCRDFGQSALASKAELAGKCAVFVLSVPLLKSVLDTALAFAKR